MLTLLSNHFRHLPTVKFVPIWCFYQSFFPLLSNSCMIQSIFYFPLHHFYFLFLEFHRAIQNTTVSLFHINNDGTSKPLRRVKRLGDGYQSVTAYRGREDYTNTDQYNIAYTRWFKCSDFGIFLRPC